MGLDQYAFARVEGQEKDHLMFQWRKHSMLQTWAEELFENRTGRSANELNCGELPLTIEDVDVLETLVRDGRLPECKGRFFYGHQYQGEAADHYRDQDLQFCAWAKEAIRAGCQVIYSCWW